METSIHRESLLTWDCVVILRDHVEVIAGDCKLEIYRMRDSGLAQF